MRFRGKSLGEHFRSYRFELRHVTVLFIVILIFQVVVSLLHKTSLQKFLVNTQEWYQQDSAERLANLTTTSLELLLESQGQRSKSDPMDERRLVQGINIILSQQILNQNVREICLLVPRDTSVYAIDDGKVLVEYMFAGGKAVPPPAQPHTEAIALYRQVRTALSRNEQIHTIVEGKQTFHTFVPFVPRGEYVGAIYMRNTPDFSFITRDIITSYDETSLSFTALILFGLLAMFYISSYTLRERNMTQALLFEREKEHLTEQINHQKEMLFTKRIYHTHHKAEKIMGFIKEDLRGISNSNIEDVKMRVMKYSNFIARVIYDMKWYDPPVQTIRGTMFRTDVNDVIQFLIDNVFRRVSSDGGKVHYVLELDRRIPPVHINEFVVWEAFEPIMQNSLEHAGIDEPVIVVRSVYDPARRTSFVMIEDNGRGIAEELLARNERGVRHLFQEHVSTKTLEKQHSGYGCYIAYEIATQRLGWELDAENLSDGGCRFTFTIPHH